MQGDAGHDQQDAEDVGGAGDLSQDDDADNGGGRGQQRQQQGEAGPRQARHGELVADIGDHRRADADADAGEQQHRRGEGRHRFSEAERQHEQEGDGHGRAEAFDAAAGAALGDAVAEHDVADEQRAVEEGPEQTQRIA